MPTFVEIEGKSSEAVAAVAEALGFDMKDAYYGSVEIVYQQLYDVTEDEVNNWPEIKFIDVPDWLTAKRIK